MGAGLHGWTKLFLEKHTIMDIRGIFCSMLTALGLSLFRKATWFQGDVLTPN